MASLSELLAEYLASITKRRWQPGILDCGVFMADWVERLKGVDPIADVRGTYSTETSFARIVRREGGLVRACSARLRAADMRETTKSKTGDIAIVLAPCRVKNDSVRKMPTGAICVSEKLRAVITSDLGLVIADQSRLRALQVWTF